MADAAPSGYSGTPLIRKLGFKDGQAALFVALPDSLDWLRHTEGFASVSTGDGWQAIDGHRDLDIIHAFFTAAADLAAAAPLMMKALKPAGMAWVSWPKKASKRPTDITEDTIRAIVLPLGLVDVKVCAVDGIWSGLKLVIRKELRGKATPP